MSVPAGRGAAPSQVKSGVRAVRTVRKTYDYTLTVQPYPSGFSPPCQEVNPTIWELLPGGTGTWDSPLNIAGLEQPTVNVGASCGLAATGNSMHAILDVGYGSMRFIPQTSTGNFKVDSVDDSYALLTITDNSTGVSAQQEIYLSY